MMSPVVGSLVALELNLGLYFTNRKADISSYSRYTIIISLTQKQVSYSKHSKHRRKQSRSNHLQLPSSTRMSIVGRIDTIASTIIILVASVLFVSSSLSLAEVSFFASDSYSLLHTFAYTLLNDQLQ